MRAFLDRQCFLNNILGLGFVGLQGCEGVHEAPRFNVLVEQVLRETREMRLGTSAFYSADLPLCTVARYLDQSFCEEVSRSFSDVHCVLEIVQRAQGRSKRVTPEYGRPQMFGVQAVSLVEFVPGA